MKKGTHPHFRSWSTWRSLILVPFNWLIWGVMGLLVSSQFLGVFWSTLTTTQNLLYGEEPTNRAPSPTGGLNDEPYTDRSLVCMAQGRSFAPMQLSTVLADSKLAPVVDTTGTSISGYRVVKRETIQLDTSTSQHFSQVCERIDYALIAIQDSCEKLGYNVTRETLLIVDDIFSNTTKAIPKALPILIMPFWDNGIYAHYAIPGWDGMACVFRLDGRYVILEETIGVLRASPRSNRELKTVEWLGKAGGVWRNGWYEDGSGQRWSSDMMTTDVGNVYGIESRQYDTLTGQEIDCVTKPVPRQCLDYPLVERWGTLSKSWDEILRFNQVFISNGTHFGQFMFEGVMARVIENKYSLETFISNVSVFVLLFRWFVSMLVMANSYRKGVAPWQASGIGCMSSSRTFNVLPFVLLPRLKMTMAAFWTVGCEFEGSQRALGEAWFTVYPAIAELMLLFYSLINIIGKVSHRRVDDVLFGPTLTAFALLHRYRFQLVESGWLGVTDRISTKLTSDEFESLTLLDMFAPSVAIRMHGDISGIYYTKLVVLALNLLPLVLSENMTNSGKMYRSYPACEIEKTLALRASNVGGLGLSPVYMMVQTTTGLEAGPRVAPTASTGRHNANIRQGLLRLKLAAKPVITPMTAFQRDESETQDSVVPFGSGDIKRLGKQVLSREVKRAAITTANHHVLIGFELDRLSYLVFGGKYLISYDDWYILTSMAPLRIVEKLWNHRISVFDVVASDEGYYISDKAQLCRLDDARLRSIPFFDVTVCSFR